VPLGDQGQGRLLFAGFFYIFKRGMKGVYKHCKKRHLHRYLAEIDFRYNKRIDRGTDDTQRAEKLLQGVKGKGLLIKRLVGTPGR